MSDENGLPEATEGFARKVIQGACDRLAPALVTISPDLPRFETFSAGVTEGENPRLVLGPIAPAIHELGRERGLRVDVWVDTDTYWFEFPSFEEAPAPWTRGIQLPLWPQVQPRLARSVRVDGTRTPDPVLPALPASANYYP